MGNPLYSLREAKTYDLEFLFGVMIAIRRNQEIFNWNEKYEAFKKAFKPGTQQVIEALGRDVGRLRVLWNDEFIYLGGIQILPQYQRRGIGTAILTDLIGEARRQMLEIKLEVHEMNCDAYRLYTRLGFVEVGRSPQVPFAIEMRYFAM